MLWKGIGAPGRGPRARICKIPDWRMADSRKVKYLEVGGSSR